MKGWYKVAAEFVPPSTLLTFKSITSERVALNFHVPPLGEKIPISIKPFPVDDLVPTEDNIEWEVQRLVLRDNRFLNPSGMRSEHLQQYTGSTESGGGGRGGGGYSGRDRGGIDNRIGDGYGDGDINVNG